jgi:hypothetical protein
MVLKVCRFGQRRQISVNRSEPKWCDAIRRFDFMFLFTLAVSTC